MASGSGEVYLLQIEDSGNPGTYLTIGLTRGSSMQLQVEEFDVTTKDSSNWHEGKPGIRSWTFEGEGVIDEQNAVQEDLEDLVLTRTQSNVRLSTPVYTYTGLATLVDFTKDHPYDGEATFSLTLRGSGALTRATI